MNKHPFKDAIRSQKSLLTPLEKKCLYWVACRLPSFVSSDHLTLLGFFAMFLAGVSYAGARWRPSALLLVNVWLALNWFGDSLDGTLARTRNKLRPRYGFYVDHIVDAFGALFLLGGLALSGYMTPAVAIALLLVYLLLSIDLYLATYTIGIFELSFWIFGPTELRILLAIGNIFVLFKREVEVFGREYLFYDVSGAIATLSLAVVLVISVIRHTRDLYQAEKI
ncbi:MAG TPA: CDP-alcohol phosphatidyltransferase family protein [Acidobacteriota bacterium]|jgi:phosphatidylglycerophosphate synthase|nr:CDP-alcohol phosphatidyltransferase family protein [Acidobacteriota bacterium]